MDDDNNEGFSGYFETTVDPGNSLLIVIIVLGVAFNFLLPCFVSWQRKRQHKLARKRKARQAVDAVLARLNIPAGIATSIFDTDVTRTPRTRTRKRARTATKQKVRGYFKGPTPDHNDDDDDKAIMDVETQINDEGITSIYTCESNPEKGLMRITTERIKVMCGDNVVVDDGNGLTIVTDGDTQAEAVYISRPPPPPENEKRESRCCRFFDNVLTLIEFDYEMKRIVKLTLPFAIQAMASGMFELLTVAAIGKLIGTKEVSAYVIVNIFVELTGGIAGGFHEALTTLCSHAIGMRDYRLAGQYIQISTILFTFSSIGFLFFWKTYIFSAVEWMGFDEETTIIATEYALVILIHAIIEGIAEVIHTLLDLVGRENHSMKVGIAEEFIDFAALLVVTLVTEPSLRLIAWIQLIIGCIFLLFTLRHVYKKGWLKRYMRGTFETCAFLNCKAFFQVIRTAFPLSAGYLLMYGEWEILTIFASFLGPAEVAAWGILGSIWGAIEDITEAIGDAAEIRCAFLLGSEQPEKAKRSSYKSIVLGVFISTTITAIMLIMGETLPTSITNDPTLQKMIYELVPLFGIGNVALTVGTLCWTLLGAQGRYRLATLNAFAGSWLVTLPLSALFTIGLNYDLQGQTSAIVIGNLLTGTWNSYILFRSDWEALSKALVENRESSSDSSSSSSSSDEVSITQIENSAKPDALQVEKSSQNSIDGRTKESPADLADECSTTESENSAKSMVSKESENSTKSMTSKEIQRSTHTLVPERPSDSMDRIKTDESEDSSNSTASQHVQKSIREIIDGRVEEPLENIDSLAEVEKEDHVGASNPLNPPAEEPSSSHALFFPFMSLTNLFSTEEPADIRSTEDSRKSEGELA